MPHIPPRYAMRPKEEGLGGEDGFSTGQSYKALFQERNLLRTIIDPTLDYIYIKHTQSRFLVSNRSSWSNKPHLESQTDVLGKTDEAHLPEKVAAQYARDDQEVFTQVSPSSTARNPA